MSEQKAKRIRGKNFSDVEELALLDLVDNYKNILENKKSDAATWKQKEEAWQKLTCQFLSLTGTHRTSRTLRDKYENLKRTSRRRKALLSGSEPPTDASEEMITPHDGSTTEPSNKFDDSDYSDFHEGKSTIDALKVVDTWRKLSKANSNIYSPTEIKPDPFLHVGNNVVELDYTNDEADETEIEWRSRMELQERLAKQIFLSRNNKHSLEKEEIYLTKLQQNFLREQTIRAAEKHEEELRSLRLKNELLELEIFEKKKQLGIY